MTRRVRTLAAVAVVCVAGAVLSMGLSRRAAETWLFRLPFVERVYSRFVPPLVEASSEVLSPMERAAFAALAKQSTGRFVWSSNREGNHELYVVTLSTLTVKRLTRNPHVDYMARFSPDGRQIAFVRSQRPWVSFRETNAWDLYVMNADGTGEKRLAIEGRDPAWTPDGSGLTFARGDTVFEVSPAGGRERIVFDGRKTPVEGRIAGPALGPDQLLCLTLRNSKAPRGVGVLNLATLEYRGLSGRSACHSTWLGSTRTVIWVDANGHGGTRVMRADADRGGEETLMDLPGEFSHEYFPRVSSDQRWLVWGASAGGHEHDRADYEMFAWRIGTPWESAMRLTYSTANDQWPDFHQDE